MTRTTTKLQKQSVIAAKLEDIYQTGQIAFLVAMLDEWKLDLLLLALGDGEVTIRED
jgi:hypothetical protein